MPESTTEPMPRIVNPQEWQTAREALLAKEKELTRAHDALAAERRRLPMVEIEKAYVFEGPDGPVTLAGLFEGRRQLILYHFMFGPEASEGCDGCSMMVDDMSHPAHLHARDTSLALVSRAPLDRILPFRERMGWTLPWVSSHGTEFNRDMGVTHEFGETFALSVFLRDGERVFRTYVTQDRGVEQIGSAFSFLDLTPLGRQEDWEDSPEGWPQGPPYAWWRHHDRYDDAPASQAAPVAPASRP